MEFKSVTEIPGFLRTNPLKLKSNRKWKFGKFTGFSINLQENALPFKRKEWNRSLMQRWVEIEGEVFQVKGIEAFALGNDCDHSEVGIIVEYGNEL